MDSNKKTKIAYCTPSLYIPGGIERVLTVKANYLAEICNYDVYIILTDGIGKESYYALSPKVHIIQLDINFEELWHLSFLQKIPVYLHKQRIFRKKLEEALFSIRPDITVSMLRREINFISKIKDGSIKVGEIHVNRAHYRNFKIGNNNIFKTIFSYFWNKQLINQLKKINHFIVLTQEDKIQWKELTNISVIPNPLPFYPATQSECNHKTVIAVGRFSPEKGLDLLAQAWQIIAQSYPDWTLQLYGGGDMSPLQKYIEELGISATFKINPPTAHIADKYNESSIFVLSSRFEGFGMVIAEAMACGVPPVAFNCPYGPKHIIKDKEDGILVENGNVCQLAENICLLIENDTLRKKMGRKANMNIERFTIDRVMPQWINLFNNLLNNKAACPSEK